MTVGGRTRQEEAFDYFDPERSRITLQTFADCMLSLNFAGLAEEPTCRLGLFWPILIRKSVLVIEVSRDF